MQKVLIVDDDPRLLKMLERTLRYENLEVVVAGDGLEALPLVEAHQPDLIILDWMMPQLDGLKFIRRLRDGGNDTRVLMLTARDAIENRVEGLESGADDYLVKPFAPAELVARVHSLLRRIEQKQEKQKISYAGIVLDPGTREAWRDSLSLKLTVTEFKLLQLLLQHPRQVLEREQILREVWGYDFGGNENVIEIYVGYLRKKLEKGGRPRLIHTERGVGYVLRED